jgi:CheY-like chemotaxis protein
MRSDNDKRVTTLSQPAAQAAAVDASLKFSGYRILVAEDNPVNQQVAVRMLAKLGCRADVAANGREALLMHGKGAYHLVLMDCEMPELDGYQTTAQIRAMETGHWRTPIVALTSHSTQSEQEKCLAAGMDDFITKPVQPQLLEKVMERWLQSAAQPAFGEPGKNDELEEVQALFGTAFAELVALYQTDSPKRISLLHQAEAAGDSVQTAKVAHAFSGSCASIGATRLATLCKELELHAKEGMPTGFGQKLSIIEAEYNRISAKLQALAKL